MGIYLWIVIILIILLCIIKTQGTVLYVVLCLTLFLCYKNF